VYERRVYERSVWRGREEFMRGEYEKRGCEKGMRGVYEGSAREECREECMRG
jgi:hypothetical protein